MKAKALLIIISSFALGCDKMHTEGEKTVVMGKDTLSNVSISVSKSGNLGVLEELEAEEAKADSIHFKASGTEPGWSIEIKGHMAKFIYNYGKDSFAFGPGFSGIGRTDIHYTNTETIDGKTRSLALKVEQKPCTDAAGVVKPQTVTFTFNGKTYTGCGSLVEN